MICVSDFELHIILDIIKKYASDCDVLAFGSRYKWTPKDYSDLDLAFVQKESGKLGLNRTGDLKEAFSESDLPYRVDVVDYNGISPEFRVIIDRGNEVIYKACKNLRQTDVNLKGIVNIIDDKMAINTKINHRLEQMAQALCSDRFEDHEPSGISCEEKIREFNALIEPMFAQIRNNSDECLRLAALRDSLLPCLMGMEGETNSEPVGLSGQD